EALAVGDAVFQHRCTRRIKEMQENGTTILFVSHDPGAIRALCTRAILLNGGRMEADGPPAEVLSRYQKVIMAQEAAYAESQFNRQNDAMPSQTPTGEEISKPQFTFRHGNGSAEILRADLPDAAGHLVTLVATGQMVHVNIHVPLHEDLADAVYGFLNRNRNGIHLYGTNSQVQGLN